MLVLVGWEGMLVVLFESLGGTALGRLGWERVGLGSFHVEGSLAVFAPESFLIREGRLGHLAFALWVLFVVLVGIQAVPPILGFGLVEIPEGVGLA